MQTVLVLGHDQKACTLLRALLEAEGFRVTCIFDGVAGLAIATASIPNLLLMDVDSPRMNGLQLLPHLRGQKSTAFIPIIMFREEASEADIVLSLEQGADDFIVQPFRPRELVARVRAALRRSEVAKWAVPECRIGHLVIDAGAHTVKYEDEPVAITHTEFLILDLLARNAGTVVSREQIIHASRKSDQPVLSRSVDGHIRSLRKKLKGGGDLIMTIRAVGYRLKGIDELRKAK